MRITSFEIKIPKTDSLSSTYFEEEFKKQGLNVIRWAIVNHDEKMFTVNVSCIE